MILGIDASKANKEKKTGVEWYAYFFIEEYKKIPNRGERVVLYSQEPLRGDLAILPPGWESRVLKWPSFRFCFWTQVRLSLELLFHSPDVLFVPAHVFPIIHPKKTVMTVHDVAAFRVPESFSAFERWYSLWSAKYAVKKLWKIIVPSAFTKSEIVEVLKQKTKLDEHTLNHFAKKIQVVYHGYASKFQHYQETDSTRSLLQSYGITRPYLISIGRLEEKKNTTAIIEAYELFRERNSDMHIQLVLVGKPGYGYNNVEETLEKSIYKEDIILAGWVPQDDLPYLLSFAELFLFPSLYEGFGIPLLESFACGTSVVASDIPALQEIGRDAATYIQFKDPDEIARTIEALLKIDTLAKEKITKGLERAKEFSWKKCAEDTLKILQS